MFGTYPVEVSRAQAETLREQAQEAAYATRPPQVTAPRLVMSRRPIRVLDRFEFDKSALRPDHLRKIDHVARHVVATWRRGGAVRVVRIVGHTDRRGQPAYNVQLGRRRALAASTQLRARLEQLLPGVTRGIRFVVESRGAASPVASNRTKAGAALNRRVEIFLTVETPSPSQN
jgi:outer membrane protein OmpA-like peptidoglycan-associated protein